jgi:hypothetical protein
MECEFAAQLYGIEFRLTRPALIRLPKSAIPFSTHIHKLMPIGPNPDPGFQARCFPKKTLKVSASVLGHCFARNCVAAYSILASMIYFVLVQ